MKRHLRFFAATVSLLSLFTGCQKLGPDFTPPEPTSLHTATLPEGGRVKIPIRWWRTFHDPVLTRLVEKALGQNLDIKAAGLRILEARTALGIAASLTLPQSQTLSSAASVAKKANGNENETLGIRFETGWELDIWGKYARTIEASRARLYSAVAGYDAAVVAVAAEVARSYILYRTAQERLLYAERNAAIQKRIVRMTEVQFNSGNVSELDMQQARARFYLTESALAQIESQKLKARNALAFLLDTDTPSLDKMLATNDAPVVERTRAFTERKGVIQLRDDTRTLTNVRLVPQADIRRDYRIDANLILKRPDVKVAEHLVHAAVARLGTEEAAFYPDFSLLGSIGYNAHNTFGFWINGKDALAVTVGPAFTWNIFDFGRIANTVRLADVKLEESLLRYNKTLLRAVTETADAYQSYFLAKKQLASLQKAFEATVRAFNLSAVQYNDGLIGYHRLLSTVETLTHTQDRYAALRGTIALDAVKLYKALGGGWEAVRGGRYVDEATVARMKRRTDWAHLLDNNLTVLPKGWQP